MEATPVKTLLVIGPTAEAPRNSEGDIIQLEDGRLFLAYTQFTGGSRDDDTAHVAGSVSEDGGLTWSDQAVLFDRTGRMNDMSVSLLRIDSGGILLFYLVKNSNRDCKLYVRRSNDELRTLGEPVCATPQEGYNVVNNDRVIQLSSRRLVVPASYHADAARQGFPGMALSFLSDDGGCTWRTSKTEIAPPPESRSGLQEPGVVELSDGRICMWMRTDMGYQYESRSEDGGETWSEAKPGPLASPLSPASIKRVPWGKDLLVAWNDHSGAHPFPEGRRTPFCVALSSDEGRTWGNSKVIEADPDGWYCYTAMTFVGDTVILAYCAGDSEVGGLNRLKLTQIHKSWLYD